MPNSLNSCEHASRISAGSMRIADRLFTFIIEALAVLAGVILSLITIMLTLNVLMRALAGRNIYGMVDGIEMGLMAATFLAAPWVLRKNAHVSVDMVPMMLQPKARRRLERASTLLGAALSAVLCWASVSALLIAWSRGSLIRGVLVLPEWLLLLAPSTGAALLTIEFLRRMRDPAPAPQQSTGL